MRICSLGPHLVVGCYADYFPASCLAQVTQEGV